MVQEEEDRLAREAKAAREAEEAALAAEAAARKKKFEQEMAAAKEREAMARAETILDDLENEIGNIGESDDGSDDGGQGAASDGGGGGGGRAVRPSEAEFASGGGGDDGRSGGGSGSNSRAVTAPIRLLPRGAGEKKRGKSGSLSKPAGSNKRKLFDPLFVPAPPDEPPPPTGSIVGTAKSSTTIPSSAKMPPIAAGKDKVGPCDEMTMCVCVCTRLVFFFPGHFAQVFNLSSLCPHFFKSRTRQRERVRQRARRRARRRRRGKRRARTRMKTGKARAARPSSPARLTMGQVSTRAKTMTSPIRA